MAKPKAPRSHYVPSRSHNAVPSQTTKDGGTASKNDKKTLEYTAIIFAGFGALASAAAAGFSGWQAWIARDTEIIQNRAIVISNHLRFVSYQEPSKADRIWWIYPVIENAGNTPTKGLRFVTSVGVCAGAPPTGNNKEDPVIKLRSMPEQSYQIGLIGPKSDINGITFKLSDVKIECPVAFIAAGIVKYADIFGYPHLAEFCNYLSSGATDFSNYPSGQPVRLNTVACRHNNCTDEECGPDWRTRAIR